jgi:tRNA 5-methylaminomethyl-2-thiouridine biosynthesis bifunctional protein
VLHARILDERSVRARLRTTSYLHAVSYFAERGVPATGALQFAIDAAAIARNERAASRFEASGAWLKRVDPITAGALLGTPVRHAALYFPDATRIALDAQCRAEREHAAIETLAARLLRWRPTDRGCAIETTRGTRVADALIVCTGADVHALPQARFIEALPVEGQLEIVTVRDAPRIPIVGAGYLCPRCDGRVAIGATYEQRRWAGARASAFNLERAARFWSELTGRALTPIASGAQRGVRSVSSDRLPVVGALAGGSDRLIVDLAHGSSGTATAPIAGAIVAELCGGEFAPLTRAEMAALRPDRFVERQARRGYRHGAQPRVAEPQ